MLARGPVGRGIGWRRGAFSGWCCPVKALSKLFLARFRDSLKRDGLVHLANPAVRSRKWVVHVRATGDGRAALQYPASYVFRVAIGDHRIVSADDGKVTFTYRRVGSNRLRSMILTALEFIRRFLRHVLPIGFPKVRQYGFLSPASRVDLDAVCWLIALERDRTLVLNAATDTPPAPTLTPCCPSCGSTLRRAGFVPALRDTS